MSLLILKKYQIRVLQRCPYIEIRSSLNSKPALRFNCICISEIPLDFHIPVTSNINNAYD